jgi:cytochrome c-type biogenesis protein CcmF
VLIAGKACLILALVVCLYGIGASVYGARSGRRDWVASGRRAVYALAGTAVVAFVILQAAFLRSDFSFSLVLTHSSTTTPTFYRATAMWSSQEGSLLLWLTLLALWSSLILFITRRRLREIAPYATAVLLGLGAFFASLLVFFESPFQETIGPVPAEGIGLNPLLRHPSMMIHPPMLYSGYTLFAIPFAFAIGALVARRLNSDWIRHTRPFTLTAWFFLGLGIVLGARWSYSELGWGGYWAWDPVENASLMPWLTGTAFLHSAMIQEKRGMLKVWNVSLVLATGVLAILGTFLVRSGILESIHAFGASTLGVPFLLLIATMIASSVYLVASRAPQLKAEHRLDSLLSREAMFLLNNLVLVLLCAVIWWGTFFPLISEALTGRRHTFGPPMFDTLTVPLALLLVLLSGIGPLIAWRRATVANLRRNFVAPIAVAAAVGVFALGLGAGSRPDALIMFIFAGFVLGGVTQELIRGTRARRVMAREPIPVALVSLIRRNRRRYGGYIVHAGMAFIFVGIAASSSFAHERDVQLQAGQSTRVGGYTIEYAKPTAQLVAARNGRLERIDLGAELHVSRPGQRPQVVRTEKSFFPSEGPTLGPVSRFFEGESTSEVGLQAGLRKDFWVSVAPDTRRLDPRVKEGDRVFAKADKDGGLTAAQRDRFLGQALDGLTRSYATNPPPATFRLLISPMVTWIWLGALVVLLGGLIALWPSPRAVGRRVTAAYAARVGREAREARVTV